MKITILIPCHNEVRTIAKVINSFMNQLPKAEIVVFDNNSTDNTVQIAKQEGASVITVKRKGKGYVIQKMFELVDSDIYVLVDGDNTYYAEDVHKLIEPIIKEEADMVIGRRYYTRKNAMKKINKLGNIIFSKLLSLYFGEHLEDILSGYRAVNRKFVQNIPIITHEFEVETELTIQALSKEMTVKEVPVSYKKRPRGSFSKLHPFKDGYTILLTIFTLFRELKPIAFFGTIAILLWVGAIIYGAILYFLPQGATIFDAVLLTSLSVIGFLFVSAGLFLHTINGRFRELQILIKREIENNRNKALS